VPGFGAECEFCRGNVVGQGDDLETLISPFFTYVSQFGHKAVPHPRFVWTERVALRRMQTDAAVRREDFIDDFLRFGYPVFHRAGGFHLLMRLPKPSFVVYTIIQLVAADIAARFALADLIGNTPFHALARGWAHWIGYEAAQRLGYDLERRQLRKWPELGLQGEFERFEKMAHFKKPKEMAAYFLAHTNALARKHLADAAPGVAQPDLR